MDGEYRDGSSGVARQWAIAIVGALIGSGTTLLAGVISLPLLLGQLQQSTVHLESAVARHDDAVDRLAVLDERAASLDKRVEALEDGLGEVAQLTTRVIKLESWDPAMGVLEKRVEALNGRAESALGKIIELERLQTQIVETAAKLDQLRGRIERLRSIEEKLIGLSDPQLLQLDALISAVRDKGFQTELAVLRRRVDDTLSRVHVSDGTLVVDGPLIVNGLVDARHGVNVESESHRAHYGSEGVALQDKESWRFLKLQHVAPTSEPGRNDLVVTGRLFVSQNTGMGSLVLRDERFGRTHVAFLGGAVETEGRLTFDGAQFSLGQQRAAGSVDLHVDRLVLRQGSTGLIFAKPAQTK